jgi:hypothetical protein
MGVVPTEHGKDCEFVLRYADFVEDELDYERPGIAGAVNFKQAEKHCGSRA